MAEQENYEGRSNGLSQAAKGMGISDRFRLFPLVGRGVGLDSEPPTFGSVRPEFEPHFLKIPESSGTLRRTEFCPSPGTGQKPALTPYLTTVGKFHNRV